MLDYTKKTFAGAGSRDHHSVRFYQQPSVWQRNSSFVPRKKSGNKLLEKKLSKSMTISRSSWQGLGPGYVGDTLFLLLAGSGNDELRHWISNPLRRRISWRIHKPIWKRYLDLLVSLLGVAIRRSTVTRAVGPRSADELLSDHHYLCRRRKTGFAGAWWAQL